MSTRKVLGIIGGLILVLVLGVLVGMLVNRGGSDSTSPRTGPGEGHIMHDLPIGAADSEIDAVAEEVFRIAYTWEPRTDVSTGDGLDRAAPLLAGELAAAVAAPPVADPPLPPQWKQWSEDGSVIRASVEVLDGEDDLAAGTATRLLKVTQTVMHQGGALTPRQPIAIDASLVETADGWKVNDFRVVPPAAFDGEGERRHG